MNRVTHHLSLCVQGLEIARGYDGFLRGKPEPIVIVSAYVIQGSAVRTMGRSLHRFTPTRSFPSIVLPDVANPITARAGLDDDRTWFAIVALALEEDTGRSVQTLYGEVESHHALRVLPAAQDNPNLWSMTELSADHQMWRYPQPVHLLIGDRDAANVCDSDKWIGAAAWLMEARRDPCLSDFRLHFQSRDRRNDWTAFVVARQYRLADPTVPLPRIT